MSRWPLIGAGLVLLVALVVVGVVLRGGDASSSTIREGRAADFVGSVGVNVHLSYVDTSYRDTRRVLRLLDELGVRHVRDGIITADDDAQIERLGQAARAGIATTLITGEVTTDPAPLVGRLGGEVPRSALSLEGPNEIDAAEVPDWPARLRAFMPRLRDAGGRVLPGVEVLGPSFIDLAQRERVPFAFRDGTGGNIHPYPGGQAPETNIAEQLAAMRGLGAATVFATETGYHDAATSPEGQQPGVSRASAAVYLPRLLLEYHRVGVRRTFLYELLDERPDPSSSDPEQHFGLYDADLRPKPSARNVAALMRTMRASGAPAPGVRGVAAPDDVRRVVLTRSDGSRVLALWRARSVWDERAKRGRSVEDADVTIDLAGEPDRAEVVRLGPQGPQRDILGRGARITVPVGADVTLVELSGGG